ncbi:hypothetical protein [Sphingomonas sp. JC676]|nr:hypothetical protein [Sphingomonas sp. JC676]
MKTSSNPRLVCIGRVSTLTKAIVLFPPNEGGSLVLGIPTP